MAAAITALTPRPRRRIGKADGVPVPTLFFEAKRKVPKMRLLHAAYRKSVLVADIGAAIVALEAGLLFTNIDQIPSGPAAFLAMRITVKNLLLLLFFLAGWHLVLLCGRVYETGEVAPLRRWKRLIMACTIGSAPVLLFVETSHTGAFRMENAALFWVCALVLLLVNRVCHAAVGAVARKQPARRCLIVGSGPVAMDLYNTVLQAEFPRWEVLGFVDDPGAHSIGGHPAAQHGRAGRSGGSNQARGGR